MKKYFSLLTAIIFISSAVLAQTITLTTSPVAAASIAQGSTNNIVYAVRMDVASLPVTVNSMQFTLTGTHDNNDLTELRIFFNATAPTLAGASQNGFIAANFAAPHSYNAVFNNSIQTIAAGASGYFIIVADVHAAATSGNTVKINGLANPVSFGYTTSPNVANNQTDITGTQTIISSTLPLTLLNFTASAPNAQGVQLQWTTTSETNTKHFEIEWNSNGQQFTNIATLPAAGNSSQTLHYNYLHSQPVSGNNFYRLKMVDMDGQFTFSPVIVIKSDAALSSVKVFPNPVTDILQLYIQSEKRETIIYSLYNADGKLITSKKAELIRGSNLLSWNLQHLIPGNYFLTAAGNGFETIKIIKQ